MCHTDFYMYNHNATYIVSDTTMHVLVALFAS